VGYPPDFTFRNRTVEYVTEVADLLTERSIPFDMIWRNEDRAPFALVGS